ncbi:hypothetical protein [Rhizobium binae]|uniref:hypothetical protein n=1 Tax=Rhizobium binae TaxID=1138190 RepID=UPI001C838535|nr:hypothetical protein [Rhizobium binae]MBX4938426.1 hypothetical protein [Rhizobium binae]MBX4944933.1 hypothetical protein [Rhizobium binae]MBX4968326.1 hypothetical protein [Rhizobium binae]MBX4980236.1 hypothetical protein [Rhizobium binae]
MKEPRPEPQFDPIWLQAFVRALAREAARKDADTLLRGRDSMSAEQRDAVDKLGWELNMAAISEAVESDEQFRSTALSSGSEG